VGAISGVDWLFYWITPTPHLEPSQKQNSTQTFV
jgi:hypothetical protein